MLMQPLPLVKKNISLSLFQEISLTSNLNCSSARGRWVFASMKVTTSSLFPTAMVWPSGLQHMLIFSPENYSTSKILSDCAFTKRKFLPPLTWHGYSAPFEKAMIKRKWKYLWTRDRPLKRYAGHQKGQHARKTENEIK